jgi:hypothetical protein
MMIGSKNLNLWICVSCEPVLGAICATYGRHVWSTVLPHDTTRLKVMVLSFFTDLLARLKWSLFSGSPIVLIQYPRAPSILLFGPDVPLLMSFAHYWSKLQSLQASEGWSCCTSPLRLALSCVAAERHSL